MPSSLEQRRQRRLAQSRDRWKARATTKQQEIRRLRVRIHDLLLSRDRWKQRCRAALTAAPAPEAFPRPLS